MLFCFFVPNRNEEIVHCCLWWFCSPVQLKVVGPVRQPLRTGMTGDQSNKAVLLPDGKSFWVNTSINQLKKQVYFTFICGMVKAMYYATKVCYCDKVVLWVLLVDNINGCESAGFCETSTVCYVQIAKQFILVYTVYTSVPTFLDWGCCFSFVMWVWVFL